MSETRNYPGIPAGILDEDLREHMNKSKRVIRLGYEESGYYNSPEVMKEYNLNLRGENDMSGKRFSTEELKHILHGCWSKGALDATQYNAIITKLGTADKLCEVAKRAYKELSDGKTLGELDKAIADYEKGGLR